MAAHLIDDGLFQRFLTIHTKPADARRRRRPAILARHRQGLSRAAQRHLPNLHRWPRDKPLPCYFDEDARAERQRFMRLVERLQVDPTLPTIIRETAPKWSGLLARLALVFHVVELAEQRNGGSCTIA